MSPTTKPSLILSVYLPTFILSFGKGMLIPILPLFAKSFATSYGVIGLILAAEGIGTLVGDLPAGIFLRKVGRKSVMILGVCCITISVLALFWVNSISGVLFWRLVSGFGSALWNISRFVHIAEFASPFQRGRAIAAFGGISRIGTFAGPAFGGIIGTWYSLRTPFLIYAGLTTLTILTSVLFVEKNKLTKADISHSNHKGFLTSILRTHYRQLAIAGSGQLFAQMVRTGRHIVIPLYATEIIGLDLKSIGWILSTSSFIDMALFYPAGLIMDHLGRKYASVPSFVLQAIGLGLIPFTGSFPALLLASSVVGLGNGLGSGSMMTLGADLAPKDSMGEFIGIWRFIGDSGNMGGPIVIGNIADILSLSEATFIISGIGLLAAFIFALMVPETLRNKTCSRI